MSSVLGFLKFIWDI